VALAENRDTEVIGAIEVQLPAQVAPKNGKKRKIQQAIETAQVQESETVAQLKARVAELEADRVLVETVAPQIEDHYADAIGGRLQAIRGNVLGQVAREVQPAGDTFQKQVYELLNEFGIGSHPIAPRQ
jgi:hypothetical protein